jgi:hypothetical protein
MRYGTKRAASDGTVKDHKHTVPAPTHCFGCEQRFDGEPICYDTRYPVIVEHEKDDGTIAFAHVVAGFHESCRAVRRATIFALKRAAQIGKPTP